MRHFLCRLFGVAVASLLVPLSPARAGALEEYFARIATAPLAAQIDTRGTFRDSSFGTPCSTTSGFAKVKDAEPFRVYQRSTDKLAVGTGALTAIRLLCVDDAFRAVVLGFPEGSPPAVATAMVGTYGAPGSNEKDMAYWRGLRRVAWLGRTDGNGDFVMTMGGLPWADPLALMLFMTAANARAGQTDLQRAPARVSTGAATVGGLPCPHPRRSSPKHHELPTRCSIAVRPSRLGPHATR